jgi:tagatose 1,6-diphosphate aldolase
VNNDVFAEAFEISAESGANFSGVLCGRTTWKDGISVYAKHGVKVVEGWLSDQGIKNINDRLKAAKPGFSSCGVSFAAALAD